MRETMITIAGILLVALGSYGLYDAWSGAGYSIFAWIAIIIGLIALFLTYGKKIGSVVEKPENSTTDHAHAEIRALVQSMGVMALADNELETTEIATIANIHEQMLGINITEAEIRDILSEFTPDFDITHRLERDRGLISPTMKRLIIQSCHLVMVSDLEIDKQETGKIHEIGKALGFSDTDVKDILATVST